MGMEAAMEMVRMGRMEMEFEGRSELLVARVLEWIYSQGFSLSMRRGICGLKTSSTMTRKKLKFDIPKYSACSGLAGNK
jgi:hypothetical protein